MKPPPTAPPMMLRPLMWPARSGYFWNSRAMLVNVPVETSQAVSCGVAMSARYAASRWSTSVAAGSTGCGNKVTPSRPDSPARILVHTHWVFSRTATVNISCMHSIPLNGLCGSRVDFDITPAYSFENGPGVVRGLVERSITMDCAHAKQLHSRVVAAEKKSIRILRHKS